MIDRLYGLKDAENLDSEPNATWERWWDDGGTGIVEIFEWSATGFETFAPSGSQYAETVADNISCDIMFEDAADVLMGAAANPDVIAAFDVAVAKMIEVANEGGWAFADKILRTGRISTADTDSGPEMMLVWDES
jgi:hypothetical protein